MIGRNFAFQNELGLAIKTLQTVGKQPKIAYTNSPWAYIGRTYNRRDICGAYFLEGLFLGGGGLIIGILRYIGGFD